MNEISLQQKYEFALDYIRVLERRVEELESQLEFLQEVATIDDHA